METRRKVKQLFLFWITLVLDFTPAISDPLLYYTEKTNLRSHDLETGRTSMVLPSAFKNGAAMDFHYGNHKLYVGDTITREVHSVTLNAVSLEPGVDLDLFHVAVHGLAVDWVNNKLYWTDTGSTFIYPFYLFIDKKVPWNLNKKQERSPAWVQEAYQTGRNCPAGLNRCSVGDGGTAFSV